MLLPVLVVLALAAQEDALPPVPLVEVNGADDGEVASAREMQALEDAIALAFHSDDLHVETRRQRVSRIPPAVYFHAQALGGCANPRWPKARVIKCVKALTFPRPAPQPPRFVRATHQLRITRHVGDTGETVALTLLTLGRNTEDKIARRTLRRDATIAERKGVALEMASELLGPIRDAAPPD